MPSLADFLGQFLQAQTCSALQVASWPAGESHEHSGSEGPGASLRFLIWQPMRYSRETWNAC